MLEAEDQHSLRHVSRRCRFPQDGGKYDAPLFRRAGISASCRGWGEDSAILLRATILHGIAGRPGRDAHGVPFIDDLGPPELSVVEACGPHQICSARARAQTDGNKSRTLVDEPRQATTVPRVELDDQTVRTGQHLDLAVHTFEEESIDAPNGDFGLLDMRDFLARTPGTIVGHRRAGHREKNGGEPESSAGRPCHAASAGGGGRRVRGRSCVRQPPPPGWRRHRRRERARSGPRRPRRTCSCQSAL